MTTVVAGHRPYRPWSAETLTMLNIDKLFENSANRSFYVTKPHANSTHVSYHVEIPGGGNSCIAEISTSPTYAEDAKKIALSLTIAK